MGSPVSVVVANLVMEDVEERALSSFSCKLPFWKRYVDDTCTTVPEVKIDELKNRLNGIEDSIQFTVEVENDSKLPFLDVLLHHEQDGSITTMVYRKPSHTDMYLNYRIFRVISRTFSTLFLLLFPNCDLYCKGKALSMLSR